MNPNWISIRALVLIPPLLAASAVASSSEDCRSGSHTSSQPNNRPANRVKLLDSK
ncbi:Uncharacterised protein [Mycobacterium tuberculosis]|nr:Uncharacterised protein [Mycobacterium tuberculosis]CKR38262.1 Uncharacterised protein [Mycobacterium tuberculosis]CKY04565.1 Uncharacterised protein [Mycobacterium tuberculosis]CMS09503.1 Uncharacterised protein [Mycobacterium tuberculosis]CNU57126.1 Uncharacterised protein [Mycobacterium tuberculosis]